MLEFEQTEAIGVTCRTPDTRTSLDMLLAEAGEALYEGKNTGRNKVCRARAAAGLPMFTERQHSAMA